MLFIVINFIVGDVYVNMLLMNFVQKYMQDMNMFVGMFVVLNLFVVKQGDLYYEFSCVDFFCDQVEECVDGIEFVGGGFKLVMNLYFVCVYLFYKDVIDWQCVNQDMVVQFDNLVMQFVMFKFMICCECVFQNVYMQFNIWFNGGISVFVGQNVNWVFDVLDLIVDICIVIRMVYGVIGLCLNKMFISWIGWDMLLDNDVVLVCIIGGVIMNMLVMVMCDLIVQMFELDGIFVMDFVVNMVFEDVFIIDINQGESIQFVVLDNCLFYYVFDGVGLEELMVVLQFLWIGFLGVIVNGMCIICFWVNIN